VSNSNYAKFTILVFYYLV